MHEDRGLPSIVRVACPAAVVASVNGLLALVVTLLVEVLSATGSVETTAAAEVAFDFVWWTRRELIPLNTGECGVLGQKRSRQKLWWSLHAALWERLETRLGWHHAAEILAWHRRVHAVAIVQLLVLSIPTALLLRLLFKQGTNAYSTSFGPEVTPKSICTSESPATTPIVAILEMASANKLFLAGVQAFVSLPVVLAGKSFSTNAAHKRTLIRVRAQMRAKIVRPSEALRAKSTLKCCGVLLCALRV